MRVAALSHQLRTLRRSRGFSQQILATRAGLSIDEIRSIEQGRIPNPGVLIVVRIAGALNVPIDELLGMGHGENGLEPPR